MNISTNKLKSFLALIIIFSLIGCVTTETNKRPTSSNPNYFFADIETLQTISAVLKRDKNPEQLQKLIDTLENKTLKKQLLTELKISNFSGMQSMVLEELTRLVAMAVKQIPIEKTADSYKDAGKRWGLLLAFLNYKVPTEEYSRMCIDLIPPVKNIHCGLVEQLVNENRSNGGLDFFFIHAELKHAFFKGFRQGYEERTADLLLGPHIQLAGGLIGDTISKKYVKVIETFEQDWVATLRRSIDVFITLISEGSQADREEFINNFIFIYKIKFEDTEKRKKEMMGMISEGGTSVWVNMSEAGSALDIPSDLDLKTEIYRHTFKVMGHEIGRRFRHNLMKRDDLIDLLRRSKPVFSEAPKMKYKEGLRTTQEGFEDGYESADAIDVFLDMAKVAGLI